MDTIKKLFPFSFRATDAKETVIAVVLYLIADLVCGIVIGVLGKIPVLGVVFSIIGWLAGLYFLIGIVLTILAFLGVLKD